MQRLTIAALCCWMILGSIAWSQNNPPPFPPTFQQAEPTYRPYPLPHEPIPQPAPTEVSPFQSGDWQYNEGIASPLPPPPLPPETAPRRPATPPARQARHFHLREAAHHLEVAGLKDYADNLRALANKEERNAELEQKLEALKALQAEIEQLREMTRGGKQIVLQVQVLEIQPDELKALLGKLRHKHDRKDFVFTVVPAADIAGHIEALKHAGSVDVVSEPRLVTQSGQSACVCIGGEVPIIVGLKSDEPHVRPLKFGTSLTMLPVVLDGSGLRLEVNTRVSSVLPDRGKDSVGRSIPGLRVREFDMGVEIRTGDSLIICSTLGASRLEASADDSDEEDVLEQLILVTPSFVDSESAPGVKNSPVVDQPRRTRPRAPR